MVLFVARTLSLSSAILTLTLFSVIAAASDLPVLSGLSLHLNAADPLNGGAAPGNNSSPTSWLDSSGLNNHAGSKAGDPRWVASGGGTFNRLPVFRFDGNDSYLVGSTSHSDPLGVHGANAATIISVINPQGNTLDGNTRWFGNTGGLSDFFGQTHGGSSDTLPSGGAGTNLSSVFSALGPNNISGSNDRHIISTVLSQNLRVTFDNGVQGVASTSDWGAATTISTNSQKGVGAFENGGNRFGPYTGDIAEIIVYNRALSSTELSQVEAHLQNKYTPAAKPNTFAINTGMVLHMDASDPLDNGGATLPGNGSTPTFWRDTSGNFRDTTGIQGDPNWIADGGTALNNQPVFRFDGNDAYRIGDDGNVDPLGLHGVADEVTIISVINPQGNDVTGSDRWFGHTTARAFGHQGGATGEAVGAVHNSADIGEGISSTTIIDNSTATHIFVSTHSQLLREFYANGVLENADTTDWGLGTTIDTPAPKGIGAYAHTGSQNLSLNYTGDIAEILVFDRALNDAERIVIENGLGAKYNTTINVDHYDGDLTANGNYDFNVIGVGQAADGSQVVSSSAAGFGLEVTGGFASSEEFIFAGQKKTANSTTTLGFDADTIDSGTRWTREWFVDANGSDATLDLIFDFFDSGLPDPLGDEEFSLLFKPDEATDYLMLESGGLLQPNGSTVLFSGIDASAIDGGIVTLGINVTAVVPEPGSLAIWVGIFAAGLGGVVAQRRRCL